MARTEVMEELDSCIKEWLNETLLEKIANLS